MILEVWRDVRNFARNDGVRDLTTSIGKTVEEANNIKETEEPILAGASSTVHDRIHSALDILDLAFGRVLVLMFALRLTIIDRAHA